MFFFFFTDTTTTEIYTYLHTLSLHDALPISRFAIQAMALTKLMVLSKPLKVKSRWMELPSSLSDQPGSKSRRCCCAALLPSGAMPPRSEEHTSELQSLMRISYAVFCLKKKKQHTDTIHRVNRELATQK